MLEVHSQLAVTWPLYRTPPPPKSQASSRWSKTLTTAAASGWGPRRNWALANKGWPKRRRRGERWRSNWSTHATKWTWRSVADKRPRPTARSWYVKSQGPRLPFVPFRTRHNEFHRGAACVSVSAGPTSSADPGAPDLRGVIQQHPAECGAALGSWLPEHKLSDACQPEHQPKVINWTFLAYILNSKIKLMPVLLVCFNMCAAGPHRLTTIDESASILSDISYDKTDDSLVSTLPVKNKFTCAKKSIRLLWCLKFLLAAALQLFQDWDSSHVRTVRLKKREKRVG